MAKKVYRMDNLDCANCAAKIEEKFNAHPQVEQAVITFSTRQLHLTAQDPDALIPELMALARTVEENVTITEAGHHHHDHGHACSCGHHHEKKSGFVEKLLELYKEEERISLFCGIVLFALALLQSNRTAALGLYLLAYVLLGREILFTAAKNLVKGRIFDENFLMSLATIGAIAIGETAEAVGVMLFYRVGEYFEHRAVERSRSQIMDAVDMRPETVHLVDNGAVRDIPAGNVRPGDVLLVRPGDRIPVDGVVLSGESRLDTAPITGEPVPVRVRAGSAVTSGCVNTVGQLTIRAEKPLSESMVTRILNSVENAAANKPKIDRFITRFARVYTPVVVGIAIATAVLPSLVTGNWNYWVYTALTFLVMSCPCALVLSVPLAFFAGIGAGSRKGILFKGGQSMEAMSGIKAVVMDKTGTITRGDFKVQSVVGGMPLLQICASCEQQSTHPIAGSIVAAAKEKGLELLGPESLLELPGKGIHATLDGHDVLCGNEKLLSERGVTVTRGREAGTKVYVSVDGAFRGYLVIGDTLKRGAETAVRNLRDAGYATVMLTGDAPEAAKAVAGKVGIKEVFASLLPQQKLEKLEAIRREKGPVMFVGDGINDAPVLAGADVGAAMGSGADAAIEAADVVFMTSDVEAIGQSLAIARETRAIAWQNVIFALVIKAIVMVLGLFGYASMWLAVFADSGVAMLCVLNAIRLLYKK